MSKAAALQERAGGHLLLLGVGGRRPRKGRRPLVKAVALERARARLLLEAAALERADGRLLLYAVIEAHGKSLATLARLKGGRLSRDRALFCTPLCGRRAVLDAWDCVPTVAVCCVGCRD